MYEEKYVYITYIMYIMKSYSISQDLSATIGSETDWITDKWILDSYLTQLLEQKVKLLPRLTTRASLRFWINLKNYR